MAPSLLKRLETLFRDMMDPGEIRRFISNLYGRQITSQLPENATHELLAHGTVTVLDRNGLINHELFIELVSERPALQGEIESVAQDFGVTALECVNSPAALARPVRTPDYVVRDTYESLRRQRTLLRELTHGNLHLSRIFGTALRQDEEELAQLPRKVAAWIDAHRHELTLTDLKGPLETVYLAASAFVLDPGIAAMGSVAVIVFGGDKVLAPLNQLFAFANLSDPQLYELTLKLVESKR